MKLPGVSFIENTRKKNLKSNLVLVLVLDTRSRPQI